MVDYEVIVSTVDRASTTTSSNVFIKLVGEDGESNREGLGNAGSFSQKQESSCTVSCPTSIGKLVLIELDIQPVKPIPFYRWLPAKVVVKVHDEPTYNFPIYRWITGREVHRFKEGTALRVFDENHDLGKRSREEELRQRKKDYRWDVYNDIEGIPHNMKAKKDRKQPLPPEVTFSFIKAGEFDYTLKKGLKKLNLKELASCREDWPNIPIIRRVFCENRTKISDYVQEHWTEDAFFGYQYLNGVNPMLIRRCSLLPENFPVKDDMLSINLTEEMREGNIFLCDYKRLDGLQGNFIKDERQYLMAPLVLLHKAPDEKKGYKLIPIAIQLKQTPAEDNPIFLPTDTEYDWLLAKVFVRGADFSEHQLNVHLLRTHLMAEVFAVSLLRNLPMVHPLYKLLIPHTRYVLNINLMARTLLISSERGAFTKYAASGGKALITILQRSLSSMTYRSLCIPDDIADRGLQDVPNYYYRDDGLKHWDILHGFVHGVLSYYYKSDGEVAQDTELQDWISDIFENGFLSQECSGIPQRLTSVAEMVKFVTMVIFTCSVQHSAVNAGQYNYGGWMPNSPITLKLPPPTTKGTTSEDTLLKTLPDIMTTANANAITWLLSRQSSDKVLLGEYLENHFTEEIPCKEIKAFQGKLEKLSSTIKVRNEGLEVPYTYMDPKVVENSVTT